MSSVINLRAYVDPSRMPMFVLIDMQQEYIASPRFLAIPEAAAAIANCRAAFRHAQALGLPVAFVRWAGKSSFFNAATRFSRWIDGFQPSGTDMVFERGRPSCYASETFSDAMGNGGGEFIIAGFAGESACLSTAVDAYHRGHRFTYLADASASHRLDDLSAGEIHNAVSKVIALYGEVMTTQAWIAITSKQAKGKRAFDAQLADS